MVTRILSPWQPEIPKPRLGSGVSVAARGRAASGLTSRPEDKEPLATDSKRGASVERFPVRRARPGTGEAAPVDTQELTGGCDRAHRPQEVLLTARNASACASGSGFLVPGGAAETPAMESPGEPAADPLRAPSPPGRTSAHLEGGKPSPDPTDRLYDVPAASVGQRGGPSPPGRAVSLRERLLLTRPVWLQLRANAAAALHVLRTEPPGTFLVRKSNTRRCQALCVRLPEASGPSFVSSHYILERPGGVSLESSELEFPDLVSLICAYCHTRDILLLPLQLPAAILQAATHKELEAISHLGVEFWSSGLNTKTQCSPGEGPLLPSLKSLSPQESDQGTSGTALCFFNPLFPGDLGPTKREKFKRSFKVRVSTETSSPLSPPAVPPPPVPVLPGATPSQVDRLPPRQLLRRESSVGYRVPGGAGPRLPPLPSLQEVDCGSPSSSEEEAPPGARGSPATSPSLGRRRPLFRSMSAAFCSLLAPERQVGRLAATLMRDRHTAVGQLVQDLLTQVRAEPKPQELQTIREALSRARAMLSTELGPEKLLPPKKLEHILEKSLHRSVLKPLRPILAARLRRRLSADGSLGRLAEGLRLARTQGPSAFGAHLSLPSPLEVDQVRQKLLQLLRAYSPGAQIKRLLQACKLLYTALRAQAGEGAGADEFLPLLSLVLAQCDLPDLLLEAEYMSELLEPTLLTGEGGYYLTSLSASLALLSGLGAHTLPLSPSQELQRSLSLWEQRRLPATHTFQNLLRVAYQDPCTGCTSKTLALPPGTSIATLNQLCATKFRVTQPDAFGLFLYKEQGYQRLPPGALAHGVPTNGYLVYRRAEWPEVDPPGTATEKGSREDPDAGSRAEEDGPQGNGEEVQASIGDMDPEAEKTVEGVEGQAGPAKSEGPEAEGSQAAEE
ncbi:PREDICTED: ras and Rab interactor 1 [Elephantulus edwardii]|uniref:ras and Rab interactor 1 n=1 Tax=Elephantulus edwardii TaxID=28737 RepID=UPI0003F0B0D0|nr:PREDICTED: ras and Rab interactor 1 [Elephantulus edwardii]